jgi:hypothetical protein
VVAGEVRKLTITLTNTAATRRAGKFVFAYYAFDDNVPFVETVDIPPHRNFPIRVEDFCPLNSGPYGWRYIATGSLEQNALVPDAELKRRSRDADFTPFLSFEVQDALSFAELQKQRRTERWRWIVLAVLTAIAASGAILAWLSRIR